MWYWVVMQRFWKIGYCLFYGKFMYYMSGPKSYGQFLHNFPKSFHDIPVPHLVSCCGRIESNRFQKKKKCNIVEWEVVIRKKLWHND